jgi:hypothetical protein
MLKRRRAIYIQLFGVVFAMAFLMLQGCGGDKKPDFKTEYQAVLLGDGQVYFGRVDKIEKDFLVLSDVYYIQRNPASGAGEGQPIMLKRGKEPHGPDISYINTKYIVMVEPVKPDSPIANTIYEIKQKMAGSTK